MPKTELVSQQFLRYRALAAEQHLGELAEGQAHHEGRGRHDGRSLQGAAEGCGEIALADRLGSANS